ncbi:hypothetical protein SDC9_65564 [bioreactor metagenome]|uniref:Uncharacterized protein n=1 Tax=bioreactor metagenome TaxID=1076179 RepID=A0A644XSE6_9ZZZZ
MFRYSGFDKDLFYRYFVLAVILFFDFGFFGYLLDLYGNFFGLFLQNLFFAKLFLYKFICIR